MKKKFHKQKETRKIPFALCLFVYFPKKYNSKGTKDNLTFVIL